MVDDYVGRLDNLLSTSADGPTSDGIFQLGLSVDNEGSSLLALTSSDNAMVSKVVLALSSLTHEMDHLCRYTKYFGFYLSTETQRGGLDYNYPNCYIRTVLDHLGKLFRDQISLDDNVANHSSLSDHWSAFKQILTNQA